MAAELSLRRAAVERVQSLLSRHLLKADVIDVIRAEKSLSPRLRAAALEIAERRTENASGLYQAGWLTVLRPGGQPEDYRLAVRRLEAACQVVTDDPERHAQYSRALALAYYRAGQPGRAIKIIETLTSGRAAIMVPDAAVGKVEPLDLAIVALASRKLGDLPRARTTLDGLRKIVQTDSWSKNQEAQVLFQEAQEVVGTQP